MNEVTVTSIKNLQQQVTYAGGQMFLIDEPESVGGEGAGPDPYTLLLAALGGCTSMTLLMYARRKGWNLERVTIRLSQERVHSKDCLDCEIKTMDLSTGSSGQSCWKAIWMRNSGSV
jgi:putative redox protein